MIDGKTKVSKIIEAIHQDYTTSPEDAAKDVAEFLQSLKEAGLIQSSK
jgi:hypothetical protein